MSRAMDFDAAFERLIGHEGGYVNHPDDPGGETKYGITKATYPAEDIKGMTLERAKAIYRRDFWGPAGCEAVPDGLKYVLFDTAVNSGVGRAVRLLQASVGQAEDGVIGVRTLQAIQASNPDKLRARFLGRRLAFMASLPTWPSFGRGWARRIAAELQA